MEGHYFGYDGPCPPWNDAIKHHYIFTIYALNTPSISLTGPYTGAEALIAIKPHIIAQASITGIYSLNPSVAI
jgi:Raf kinase inhibitor-like YbhB/YbcL family protein